MAIITSTAGSAGTGRDITIALVGFDGKSVSLKQVTKFESKMVTNDIKTQLLNSHVIVGRLPKYWEGNFEFVRGDNSFDAYMNTVEQNWFAQQGNFQLGTLIVKILEPGSTSGQPAENQLGAAATTTTLTFLDVTVWLEEAGTFSAEGLTTGRIGFEAAQRKVT